MIGRTRTTPVKVYSFGCKSPRDESFSQIHGHLYEASQYYNKLIGIEVNKRKEYRSARSHIIPKIHTLETQIESLTEEIENFYAESRKKNSDNRKRSSVGSDLGILVLKEQKKDLHDELVSLREKAKSNVRLQKISDTLNKQVNEAKKDLRKETHLYWGTQKRIDSSVDTSIKSIAFPEPHQFDGTGILSNQLQEAITFDQILDGDSTYVKIDAPSMGWNAWKRDVDSKGNPRKAAKVMAKFRIGSEVNPINSDLTKYPKGTRSIRPDFVEIPIFIHRLPPSGTRVTWVTLKVSKVGKKFDYSLQFTCEHDSFVRQNPGRGTIALNIGWKKTIDGYRVATYIDNSGKTGEIILKAGADHMPGGLINGKIQSLHSQFEWIQNIKGVTDVLFNSAREDFIQWGKSSNPKDLSKFLTDALSYAHTWRSHSRLKAVARHMVLKFSSLQEVEELWKTWKIERMELQDNREDLYGDYRTEDTFQILDSWFKHHGVLDTNARFSLCLEWWRRKDGHMTRMFTNRQHKLLSARKHFYRKIAKDLASRYSDVILKNDDYSERMKRQSVTQDPKDPTVQAEIDSHRRQGIVSPSEFRDSIRAAFGKNLKGDSYTTEIPSKDIGTDCSKCGKTNQYPKTGHYNCSSCNLSIEPSENIARNMYYLHVERRAPFIVSNVMNPKRRAVHSMAAI